jgi:hypothetical protein
MTKTSLCPERADFVRRAEKEMIDREAFEEWLAHPITEEVLKRVGELAEANKQKWIDTSWDAGNCDERVLIDLKARAQAAHDLSTIRYEDVIDDDEHKVAEARSVSTPDSQRA